MADSEAGWERFRADIRGSRLIVNTNQEKPRLQFHIPILAQAPRYRPGSGPPPPAINLRPAHDDTDTAFIVDKVVLPRGPFPPNDPIRQRRCYYIIGWPDLPAARPVVDATKVLEYVSPRTLEDWEYQDALRREEERERAEEAEARAMAKGKGVATMPVAAAAAAAAATQPGARRRPGRPPKSRMMVADTPPEPELNSEEEELVHKRMRGPSLSTPQKSRIAQLQAEVEMLEGLEETDEDTAAKITGPLGRHGEGEDTSDGDVNKRVVGDLDELRLSSAVPGTPSGGESSRASSSRPALANQAAGTLATASTHTAPRSKFPTSTTPIPLPSAFSRMKNWTPKAQATSGASKTVSRPKPAGGQGSAPPALPHSDPIHGQHSSHTDLPSHTNGFTPIGGTFPRPPKRPSDGSPLPGDVSVKTKQRKSRKKKQAGLPLADANIPAETTGSHDPAQEEQEYVVKRLEGDQVLDGVHYFKVRWEGDWPDDQNPTWEPRENLTEKLVKEYLKRKARRGEGRQAKAGSRKRTQLKQANPLADQARAFSSVLEAFEGPANLDGAGDMDVDQGGAQGGGGGADAAVDSPDELLVTDEAKELAATERRKAMQAEFAAQLAGLARSAPRHF